MKLMQKYIPILISIIFLSSVIFAINQHPNSPETQDIKDNKIITAVYTNTTANVRECGALTCKSEGIYPPNTSIDISSYELNSLDLLPEWVLFSYSATDNLSASGYINKTVLSKTQVSIGTTPPLPQAQITNKQYSQEAKSAPSLNQSATNIPSQQNYSLEALTTQLGPQLAYITCQWYSQYGGLLFSKTSNGLLAPRAPDGKYFISTVLGGVMDTTYIGSPLAPGSCSIQFPMGVSLYAGGNSNFSVGSFESKNSPVSVSNTNVDFAQVFTAQSNSYLASYAQKINYCSMRGEVGNSVAIIGYPINSANRILSGTITSLSEYYDLTNISVPDGMQGSTAVSIKNGCVLGQINSLGKIADMQGLQYTLGL